MVRLASGTFFSCSDVFCSSWRKVFSVPFLAAKWRERSLRIYRIQRWGLVHRFRNRTAFLVWCFQAALWCSSLSPLEVEEGRGSACYWSCWRYLLGLLPVHCSYWLGSCYCSFGMPALVLRVCLALNDNAVVSRGTFGVRSSLENPLWCFRLLSMACSSPSGDMQRAGRQNRDLHLSLPPCQAFESSCSKGTHAWRLWYWLIMHKFPQGLCRSEPPLTLASWVFQMLICLSQRGCCLPLYSHT